MALRHEPFEECRCCNRARDDLEVYKQEIAAADSMVLVGGRMMVVPSSVRDEIERLRSAQFVEAGRLHIETSDDSIDARAEVTDGARLQPSRSPVTFYVRK